MKRRSGTDHGDNPVPLPTLTNRDKRVAILVQFQLHKTPHQIIQDLQSALGVQAPSQAMVYKYIQRFRSGHYDLDDEEREGRPPSVIVPETVDAVKTLMDEDRRITVREIQQTLRISNGTVNTIVHEYLGMRKVSARWVPHQLKPHHMSARVEFCEFMLQKFDHGSSELVANILTGDETWIYFYDPETKEQSKQWITDEEDIPVKFRQERSVGKVMVAVFFRQNGLLMDPIALEKGATVTAQWYVDHCMKPVIDKLKKVRPKTKDKNIFLHHDNAPGHKAKHTQNFLETTNLIQLPHPPYSPDLAPCDFYLFPKIKKNLKGRRFESKEDLLEALNIELSKVKLEDFQDCFSTWFKRMEKCIKMSGTYFEKL